MRTISFAQNAPNTLSFLYKHNFKQHFGGTKNIDIVLGINELANIPIKVQGDAFSGSKRVKMNVQAIELSDPKSPFGNGHFVGAVAAKQIKTVYHTLVTLHGRIENGKVMTLNVRETDKKLTCTYRGETWEETAADDKNAKDLGTLPYKNNAVFQLQGKDNQYNIKLKLLKPKIPTKTAKSKKVQAMGNNVLAHAEKYCPITPDFLQQVLPPIALEKAELYAPMLAEAMQEFEINTPARVNMFLAQISHESDNFTIWTEHGRHSYFKKYDHRKTLGNIYPNDGYRYRGRGPLQITGRETYRRLGKALDLDLEVHPELLEDPVNAFRASACWWQKQGLNKKMDKYPDDVKRATKTINGGYKHLDRRTKKYQNLVSTVNGLEC
ncbi:MAG: class chitinase [Bacteroidota bacterium]